MRNNLYKTLTLTLGLYGYLLLTAAHLYAQDSRDVSNGTIIHKSTGFVDMPFILQLGNGQWFCVVTTGALAEGSIGQHIVGLFSSDQGKTWTSPAIIEPPTGPAASYAIPYLTSFGRIYLFYHYNGANITTLKGSPITNISELGWYCYRYSDDNGKTWSSRSRIPLRNTLVDINNDFGGTVQLMMHSSKPVNVNSGILIAYTKIGQYIADKGEGWVLNASNINTERDVTKLDWNLFPDGDSGIKSPDFGTSQEEHTITRLNDGSLICIYRTAQGIIGSSYSSNEGKTWSIPEKLRYTPGGIAFKQTRANSKIFKASNGKYLLWYGNNGTKETFESRNPAWISGGTEVNGKINWSQPEILLYSNDLVTEARRISYPDLIEENGRFWIAHSQKINAKIEELDPSLLNDVWNQGTQKQFISQGLYKNYSYAALSGTTTAADPTAFSDPRSGNGFTIEFQVQLSQLTAGQSLFSNRGSGRKGVEIFVTDKQTIGIVLDDGVTSTSWDTDQQLVKTNTLHRIAFVIDGGPKIITAMVDGRLCDGGAYRDAGWVRFNAGLSGVNTNSPFVFAKNLSGKLQSFRIYSRYLRTSELVSNYLAPITKPVINPAQAFSVNENSLAGTVVGTATAADPGPNGTIQNWSIISGNTGNAFAINPITGVITVTGTSLLDYETLPSYTLSLGVNNINVAATPQTVTINLNNLNDNKPVIASGLKFSVNEGSPAGTAVGNITATDADGATTYQNWTITAGNINNAFAISPATGALTVAGTLDFSIRPSYTLTFTVSDGAGVSASQTVAITVNNINNNKPVVTASQVFAVNENSPNGTMAGTLKATDADGPATIFQNWTIVSGNTGNTFALNAATGALTVTGAIDYETQTTYALSITVGDGRNTSDPQVITLNIGNLNDNKPRITTSQVFAINENSAVNTAVGTPTVTDADGTTTFQNWTIAGGNAANLFAINAATGAIRVNGTIDFETQKQYTLSVSVSDGVNTSDPQTIVVNVNDINEAPTDILLSKADINENEERGKAIGAFTSRDADAGSTFNYSLVSGTGSTDNAIFHIEDDQLTALLIFNYEAKSSYTIRVRTTDNHGLSIEKAFTITVNNVKEAPSSLALTRAAAPETNIANAPAGTLSATSPDAGAVFSYSLAPGFGDTDNAYFQITDAAFLRTRNAFNLAQKTTFNIRLRVSVSPELYVEKAFKIIVSANGDPQKVNIQLDQVNVNKPVITIAQEFYVNENAAANILLGAVKATDEDGLTTFQDWSITGGDGSALFIINAASGAIRLNGTLDHETKNTYQLEITTSDGLNTSIAQSVRIRVNDVNETPTDITLSSTAIDEKNSIGAVIGSFSSTDPDTGSEFSYTLVSGTGSTDNSAFLATGNQLKAARVFDFEAKNSYSIRIRTTDERGLNFEKTFTITINDVIEAPVSLTLNKTTIAENNAPDALIGTLLGSAPDTRVALTYTLVNGEGSGDNSLFSVNGDALSLKVPTDFESRNQYTIRVRTTNRSGPYLEKVFVIGVTDVNEAPSGILLSKAEVFENSVSGTLVGQFSSLDQDAGATFTYSLVNGAGNTDNAQFSVTGTQLRAQSPFDFETKNSYTIRVKTTDEGGLSFEKSLTIQVLNVPEVPTALNISSTTIAENNQPGALIGILNATCPDADAVFSYSLVTDNDAAFTINGNELSAKPSFNYEVKNAYTIRIRVITDAGLSLEKDFTIRVADVNETPANILVSKFELFENSPSGTTSVTLATEDEDAPAAFTYTLAGGDGSDDNAVFSITSNRIDTRQPLDFEARSQYRIRVRSTDAGGLSLEKAITIDLQDVNEAPTLSPIADQKACLLPAVQAIAIQGISAGPEKNQPTTLQVSADKPELFSQLSISGGTGGTGMISYLLTGKNSGSATITVTVKDDGGTENGGTDTYSRTFILTYTALPEIAITPDKGKEISKGQSLQLAATGGVRYQWATADGIVNGENSAVLTVRPSQNTTYQVTAFNEAGCSSTQNITITVLEDYKTLAASNILSPNGDGKNDKWIIRNIDLYPNNSVKVFDRSGKIVYEAIGYKNDWDGTFHGALLNGGTYYYIIDFNVGKSQLRKGFITVVRDK